MTTRRPIPLGYAETVHEQALVDASHQEQAAPLPELPDNPWRESLQNCMTGDNYLRTTEWHQLIEELDRLYAIEEAAALSPGWSPIAEAPKGRKLIVGYPNKLGKWRTVMACYYPPETLDCEFNESGWADEGWYEESESQETIMPTDEEPTHWMPLPQPPAAPKDGSGGETA